VGGKTSTTKVENEPPAWAAPLFQQGATSAKYLYDNRIGGNVFAGDTVAKWNPRMTRGAQSLMDAGSFAPDHQASSDTYRRFMGAGQPSFTGAMRDAAEFVNVRNQPSTAAFDGALTGAQTIADPANSNLAGIASGTQGIRTEGDYRNILAQAGGRSAAEQYLTDTAAGNYLTDGNPYYRQRLDREIDDARSKMQTMYAGKGRYGSMTAQRGIGEMTSNMLLQGLESDYNRERENQLRAVGMIDDQRNAGVGNRLAAVSGISGIQGQNIGNQLAATGQISDARAREAGMVSDIAGARYGAERANVDAFNNALAMRSNMLGAASQNRLAESGEQMQAANMLQQARQQAYENNLTGAQAQIQAGQLTQEQTQRELDDDIARFYARDNAPWNRLAMLFSAAQGSAGTYGTQTQTSRQPFDVMGLFGSLLSDRRLKTNAIRYAYDPRGFGLYEFSYRVSPDVRYRGVMADEVEKVDPAAVVDLGTYKVVNYERLGLKMEAV
jgi:hypothetical protein